MDLLDWRFDTAQAQGGAQRVVVLVPKAREGDTTRYPVLIALHGRGEATRGAEAGAYGWVRDYHLLKSIAAVARGELQTEDFHGFVNDARLSMLNRSLATHPYQGLIVVCPHTPDILNPSHNLEAAAPFGQWLVEALLPKVQAQCPATSETGIDGVSLGGRVALLVGLAYPQIFHAVGTLQPAFQAEEAGALVKRAKGYRTARPNGKIRLLTSDNDYFKLAVGAFHEAFREEGIAHEYALVTGPHDYSFNRGPGGIEMLLWHDRMLREMDP